MWARQHWSKLPTDEPRAWPGSVMGHPGPLALSGSLWELERRADLPQPNAGVVSLIEINLRQFRFIVTLIG
jgi:hypothetical protein